jgi:hypothetical protein
MCDLWPQTNLLCVSVYPVVCISYCVYNVASKGYDDTYNAEPTIIFGRGIMKQRRWPSGLGAFSQQVP